LQELAVISYVTRRFFIPVAARARTAKHFILMRVISFWIEFKECVNVAVDLDAGDERFLYTSPQPVRPYFVWLLLDVFFGNITREQGLDTQELTSNHEAAEIESPYADRIRVL
jgi:hypothetical protein